MQVARDPAALQVRGVDRALQQPLAILLALAHPPGEPVRERDLQPGEREQRHREHRDERAPQLPGARGHRVVQEVRLEQQPIAVRRLHREVDLEELAEVAFEAVLGLAQVADVGVHGARAERRELVRAQVEPLADQLGNVRVHDRAVGRPDLHAHDRVAQHAVDHQRVDRGEAGRVAADHAVREPRLHDRAWRRRW